MWKIEHRQHGAGRASRSDMRPNARHPLRNSFLALAGLLGCGAAHAHEWNVPLKSPSSVEELQGTIGKLPIRMHLETTDVWRCTDDRVQFMLGYRYTGWYEYEKSGKHIAIEGFYNSQGAGGASEHPPVEIYETVDGKHTGTFVTTEDNIYRGIWEAWNGEHHRRLRYDLDTVSANTFTVPEPDDSICPKENDAASNGDE